MGKATRTEVVNMIVTMFKDLTAQITEVPQLCLLIFCFSLLQRQLAIVNGLWRILS